jgi:TP901 family phage tail tape measure protein
MTAEGNIGARITLIGKAAALGTYTELSAAQARYNASIVEGTAAFKGYTFEQAVAANRAKVSAGQTAAAASVGKASILALGAAFGVVAYEGIKNYTKFQSLITQLNTQAGMTVSGMNAVAAAARNVNTAPGASPEAFAAAAYSPASTGFDSTDTIAIVAAAQKEAMISGASLTDTVNSLTSTMKSYDLHAGSAAKTQAQLNAIVGAGNMHFQDLNSAMSTGIMSTAQLFGVSIPSVGAALSYMTDRGVPAQQAATRLRMSLTLMGAPTAESLKVLTASGVSAAAATTQTTAMSKALQMAGVSYTMLASDMRKPDGIIVALQDLKKHLDAGGVSADMQAATLSRAFGGGRSGSAIMQLYSNLPGGAAKYDQIQRGSQTGVFNADYAKAMDTQAAKVKVLDANWHAFTVTLGKDLVPTLSVVTSGLGDVFGFLSKNSWAVYGLAGLVTGVLGPAMGVYLVGKFAAAGGAISKVIGFYTDMIGKFLRFIGVLGAEDVAIATNDAALASNDAALAANTAAEVADAGAGGANAASKAAGLARFLPFGLTAGGLGAVGVTAGVAAGAAAVGYGIYGALSGFGNAGNTNLPTPQAWNHPVAPQALAQSIATQFNPLGPGIAPAAPTATTALGPASTAPIHTHIYIDGKEVLSAVSAQTKARAARNG